MGREISKIRFAKYESGKLRLPKLSQSPVAQRSDSLKSSGFYLKAQRAAQQYLENITERAKPSQYDSSNQMSSHTNFLKPIRSRMNSDVDTSFGLNISKKDVVETDVTVVDVNPSRLKSNNQSSIQ